MNRWVNRIRSLLRSSRWRFSSLRKLGSRAARTGKLFLAEKPDLTVFKRFEAWRPRRSFDSSESLSKIKRRPLRFGPLIRRRRQRRWFGTLVVLLASLMIAMYALSYASGGGWNLSNLPGEALWPSQEAEPEPVPEQADTSPAAAAYRTVASELPRADSKNVQGVYKSTLDPSWASVRIAVPEEEGTYIVFLQRGDDNSWKAWKSIRADEPEHPENEKVVLDGVPRDLVDSIYPPKKASEASGLVAEPVDPGTLPTVKPAEDSAPDPVTDDVPESERERVDKGVEKIQQAIKDYDGVAGVYVQDLNGGYGYGVRPDEVFFSASVIKVPIMVAVLRKIDEGEFSLSDSFETKSEDWAAGAGWLQWQPAGTSHTVEEYLTLMMTQSDNVATNALTRLVGGPGYVNEVARSMRATNTVLYQKVSSEQAIVPSLDNRTTPRDMATMLDQISTGKAASPESCQEMIDIMLHNNLESWLKEGLPKDTVAANKAGWLYEIYNDAGIVRNEGRPYVVAIFSERGPGDPQEAKPTITGLSKTVWQTQDDS
jgi:beta-lactamase class A